MSTKYAQKHYFCKRTCKSIDEIDQDTPALSASQFKEPGLKRNVDVENKFASKIERWKWDDDYIKYGFFIPKVKNRAMSLCSMHVVLIWK